ncbi:C45 family autoproteolytic acyltransferase/hydolase [Streptomyces sp. NPDC050145]|uniref:C45 family autoproteolytic acyltransferase/hydolase n=1 Tax=Streptomyces sp. NPDC050145 TaxID=3365602 RepID=UPI0037B44351
MTATPIPRPEHRRHIVAAAADPYERGVTRGEQLRDAVPAAIEVYDRLFALGEVPLEQVRADAERALDVIGEFRPGARAQIEGIAAGSGADLWRIAALNARTEILARSVGVTPGECTTLVRRPTPETPHPFGVQTWDWHVELNAMWHTVESRGGRYDYAGLTEDGILGKIGVNSAGLALHFNILGHVRDGVGGIPMHVLAAIVLEEAGSVAEAVDLVRSAPITSSGSFTLFDEQDATLLDLSPAGVFAVGHEEDTFIRTNHFLTARLTADEKSWLYQPDSGERRDFVKARLGDGRTVRTSDDLAAVLVTGAGEPAVTCLPDLDKPLGQRWGSLATVALDPVTRTARVLDGTPADLGSRDWRVLDATAV